MPDLRFRHSSEEINRQAREITGSPVFSELLQHIPLTIMILNNARQVIYINHDLLFSSGIKDPQGMLGKRPGECLDCRHACDGRWGCGSTVYCKICGFAQALTLSEDQQQASKECSISIKGAESLSLMIHTRPFSHKGKDYILCSIEDISDRKNRQLLENIFLHDIRNTTTILSGLGQVAQELPAGDVQKILGEVSVRMNEEINAYLVISSAEDNTLAVRPSQVDVAILINQCIETLRIEPRFSGKKIRFQEHASLYTDKTLLRQVLINLLKNAMEAGPANDTIEINLQQDSASGQLIINVKNKQVIPDKIQLQLFQKNLSTKGSGRGWGTYSIRLLTEKYLKGEVKFVSDHQQGTIFSIYLPSFKKNLSRVSQISQLSE